MRIKLNNIVYKEGDIITYKNNEYHIIYDEYYCAFMLDDKKKSKKYYVREIIKYESLIT